MIAVFDIFWRNTQAVHPDERLIKSLPEDLLKHIFSYLSKNDLQALVTVDQHLKKYVHLVANYEIDSIKKFVLTGVQQIDQKVFPEHVKFLTGLRYNLIFTHYVNLKLLKCDILNLRDLLIKNIITLDEDTLRKLYSNVKLPHFMENIVELFLFKRRIDKADSLPEKEKWTTISDIIYCLSRTGHFDKANTLAMSSSEGNRERFLEPLVRGLADSHQIDKATEIAVFISEESSSKIRSLDYICYTLKEVGNIEKAVEVAMLIPDKYRTSTLESIYRDSPISAMKYFWVWLNSK